MDILILTSTITALSVIIAPVVSTYISNNWANKTKKSELYFNERTKAYSELVSSLSRLELDAASSDDSSYMEIRNAIAKAQLFSNEETSGLINRCCMKALQFSENMVEYADDYNSIYGELIEALRLELSEYNPK